MIALNSGSMRIRIKMHDDEYKEFILAIIDVKKYDVDSSIGLIASIEKKIKISITVTNGIDSLPEIQAHLECAVLSLKAAELSLSAAEYERDYEHVNVKLMSEAIDAKLLYMTVLSNLQNKGES